MRILPKLHMKKSLSLAVLLLIAITSQAHEGMWLLNKIKQVNEAEMRELGFKLTAEDIYSINQASMKDAVARLGGGFCTGELVSSEGLMLTNHHCGYDAIQGFSSVEHDYLTDGFWAMTRDQELVVPGLYVSFLDRIEDVTGKVMAELNDGMSEEEREAKIGELARTLVQEATGDDPNKSANFKTMFEGNEFYLFIYTDYRDVRLVGAPPES
ncbi:MAG: S46 family peptidase, partial [Flavobacteriales bacterium]|nr:S46 family peptidase [Flavobacteriales bacterium]